MGTGKGLLDSLIAVKRRDSSWVIYIYIYIGMVIEIRKARSDRNAAKFYGLLHFLFRRNFLHSLVIIGTAIHYSTIKYMGTPPPYTIIPSTKRAYRDTTTIHPPTRYGRTMLHH